MKYQNLFLLFAIVSATMSLAIAQPVKKFPAPVEAKIKGFAEAFCVSLEARSRVCKGRSEADDGPSGEFVLIRNDQELNRWEAAISAVTGPQNFEVLTSDLDGNGTRELIVVDFTGMSNGMGVSFHKIHIFGPDESKAPLALPVEEYGAFGSFVAQPRTPGVLLLATEWQYSDKIDPQLKSGLYLIGRWFRYHNGVLDAVNKPILARRFLGSFAKERGRTAQTVNIPYSWFANGKGRELKADPETLEKVTATNHGTIVAVKSYTFKIDPADAESRTETIPMYVVKLDAGAEVNYINHEFSEEQRKPENSQLFHKFGLGKGMVALPTATDITAFYRNLVGLRVEAISYQSSPEVDPSTILWLLEKQ